MTGYIVTICPECSSTWISRGDGGPGTFNCANCNAEYVARESDIHHADSKQEALQIRTDLETRKHSGVPTDGGLGMNSFGTAPDDIPTGADSPGGGGKKRPKKAVEEAIKKMETPSAEDIVEYATESGVQKAEARQAIKEFWAEGEIIDAGGGYKFV